MIHELPIHSGDYPITLSSWGLKEIGNCVIQLSGSLSPCIRSLPGTSGGVLLPCESPIKDVPALPAPQGAPSRAGSVV